MSQIETELNTSKENGTTMNEMTTSGASTAVAARPLGLETRGVHAWFGSHHVLSDINLQFPERSVTGLIGPSGCGKSTFLRMLNRMHEFIPSAAMAGEVLMNGDDIYAPEIDAAAMRLKIGMVFQKPNPFPAMTIRENVLSGIKLANLKVNNHDDIVEQCLSRAGLWKEVKDRLDASGGSLSGGQQQRLCIARSLAVEPTILLMDEPCSALDPGSTLRIEETIHELAEKITVVIVTHNMQQASRVSNYCAFFLSDGALVCWLKQMQPARFLPTQRILALQIMCKASSAESFTKSSSTRYS